MANIREIAKQAGVSITTVSRVLNNHPYVSEEKRLAVFNAIEKLNYTRNLNAVHLSQGKTNLIGVILPTIRLPYFASIVAGIADKAIKQNIQLVLFQTNYEISKELDALEMLSGHVIDGVIFCSRAMPLKAVEAYKDYGPIILCEDSDQADFPSISIEHEKAFQFGLDYLISKGHKKIAYGIGRKDGINSTKRTKAYEQKMKEIGEPVRTEWIFDQCFTIQDGIAIFHQYLSLSEKPSSFFVANDQVAAGFVSEARKHRIDVPEDIAVLSFDNHPIAEMLGISSIEIPTKEMGEKAFSVLLNLRNEKTIDKKKFVIPFTLHERASV
ncbi:LacI family DNA-binding transcriptional regulator [Bacillota bacterium Lsc_1132]